MSERAAALRATAAEATSRRKEGAVRLLNDAAKRARFGLEALLKVSDHSWFGRLLPGCGGHSRYRLGVSRHAKIVAELTFHAVRRGYLGLWYISCVVFHSK